EKSVIFSPENYNKRKQKFIEKIEGVIKYAYSDTKCRSQMLRAYFGEKDPDRCGECDVCKDRNELGLSRYEFDMINEQLKYILQDQPKPLIELTKMLAFPEDKTASVIRWLLDHEKIVYNAQNCLLWKRKK
ncbi:MAG: hypothetical protein CVU05_13860, partial [Bacteroidetes bacterium HGW-Bacteroidetes-21]